MKRSFYHYVLTLKGATFPNEESHFADAVSLDGMFPKHTTDYQEVSDYLELSTDYMPSMDLFDIVWQKYVENN